nr:MAG TPA: hypothetical protein [Bacteriophage sp.]
MPLEMLAFVSNRRTCFAGSMDLKVSNQLAIE